MDRILPKQLLSAALLLLSVAPLSASTPASTVGRYTSQASPAIWSTIWSTKWSRSFGPSGSISESLRGDVAQHPKDFLTFETGMTARQFITMHNDALAETDRRIVQRGILGYWQGKTLVVLPSLASWNR